MRNFLRSIGGLSLLAALLAAPSGCGGVQEPAGCPETDEIRGQCAGVPQGAVCAGDTCTSGVDCAETVTVADDASLEAALASAAAGTCIALAPGSYGAVSLPGGVSLLGRSAESVSVQGITLAPGTGAVVRGIAVGGGGIEVQADGAARIESVRVSGASAAGLDVAEGASVTLVASTIEGSARHGIAVADGAMVTMENTILQENDGPGLWAACSADCDCAAPPDVVLKSSIVRDNHIGGIVLFGAAASLESVDVTGTLVGDDWSYGLGGGGITAAACSDLTAKDLRVSESQSYGVLVDDSAATIGDPGGEPGVEITGNVVGLWAQHISQSAPQTVTLDGITLDGNAGVGLGADGDTVGLIVCKTAITGTSFADLAVEGFGTQQVGDGLLWLGGSEIVIDSLSVGGSARASVLIDGEASGSMSNVTLSDGDEAKGVVQQSYTGGSQPQAGANAPAITTSADGLFAIPDAPIAVPRNL